MTIVYEERPSDSPYIDLVTHGRTLSKGSTIRPAESHWHMVIVRLPGSILPIVVGPLTESGLATWGDGAEILWVRFKLGVFMPHLPTRKFLNHEHVLPGASTNSFWLKSTAWQVPDYENIETFVNWLVHEEILVQDPLVSRVLQGEPHDMSPRTVRHRFLQATGVTLGHIQQLERAQRAAAMLAQGKSILDTVEEAGYFDQPHLTRSLKQWVGHTPAQIIRMNSPELCQSVQDTIPASEYDERIPEGIR